MLKGVGIFVSLILLWVIWNYATCPVYNFPETETFSGNSYFNPYEDINSEFWRKGNFQAQSKAWGGITAGSQNSNEEICKIYGSLGYDFIGTSDYQKINTYACNEGSYISVYEHGYGIFKNHQVLLGSKKVLWRDYPFYQTLSNKQHILDLLKEENELVFIAHPDFAGGNKVEDLKYLSGYNGIEFQSIYTHTTHYWDAALSSGKYVTGMANDDLHDIHNTNQIGRFCNFINTESTKESHVLDAMRNAKTFAATLPYIWDESLESKQKMFKKLPILNSAQMRGDTLMISVSQKAKEIRFIGQEGEQLKSITNSKTAEIIFSLADSYIRTEIQFPNNTVFYLNPICRSEDGDMPQLNNEAQVNQTTTLLKRGVFVIVFIILTILYFRRRKKKSSSTQ